MKTTADYLEEAKKILNIESDYGLAKWIGVSKQTISQYQNGKRTIDDYTAAKIAEALGIDPWEVVKAANYEREKDAKRKAFWARIRQEAVAPLVMILAFTSAGYGRATDSGHSDAINIMRNSLRRIKAAWLAWFAPLMGFTNSAKDAKGRHERDEKKFEKNARRQEATESEALGLLPAAL